MVLALSIPIVSKSDIMPFPLTRSRSAALALAAVLLATTTAHAAAPAATAATTPQSQETLWSLIVKAGPVMYPLALCSLLALGFTIERAISLRRKRIIPEGFLAGLKQKMPRGSTDVTAAVAYCEQSNTPAGNIAKAGLVNMARGDSFVEKAIEDAGAREADKLKRSLRGLGVIVTISPLLGLLGTVYGMITAFETSTMVGSGKADLLARGIYEALVNTATGLTIAIPALVVYHILSSRIDARVDEFEDMGLEFIEHCGIRNAGAKTAAPPVENLMTKGTW